MESSLAFIALIFISFVSFTSSAVLFECTFENNSVCHGEIKGDNKSNRKGVLWYPSQDNSDGPSVDNTMEAEDGYYLRSFYNNTNSNRNNRGLFTSQWSVHITYPYGIERYTNILLKFSFYVWKSSTNQTFITLSYQVNGTEIPVQRSGLVDRWFTEKVALDQLPLHVTFTSHHLSNNDYSGVALDDVTITADLLPSTDSTTTRDVMFSGDDGRAAEMDIAGMKTIIILLLCAVGFLVLIIFFLIFILLRKRREGEFTPVGLTVANSTYDIPSTISGINTSENRYVKYGTYSGERYPPVSPASDISLPITKVSKKKRKGLTLPLGTSQATGTFEFKGVSPVSSSGPQSPDSVTSKLYVQKRSKLGLLGRAQAMIYGSPKPVSKRLSRSLPDNLEYTLSGFPRGPYQITDLINGRFEMMEVPSPPSDTSQHPSNSYGERTPTVPSPQISLCSPNTHMEHLNTQIENNGSTNQYAEGTQTQDIVVSNQHNVVNEHYKERTLDRSTLTLPLNVKRPSWDADKYQMIFDSGDEQCELLDLLQGSSKTNDPHVDEDYESVLVQEPSAVSSRNNNGRTSRGSSSSERWSSGQQTPTTPRQTCRDEVYEMVSPVDKCNPESDLCTSSDPSSDHNGAPSNVNKGVTGRRATDSDGYEVTRPSIKKKPHFKIENRKVSFSNKTSIIERPSIDGEEYDEKDNEQSALDVGSPDYYGNHLPTQKSQPPFPLVVEENKNNASNGGYVNVRRSPESGGEVADFTESKEENRPSEYEMISPTTEESRPHSINETGKDPNVYDELARDFPLKKNPLSVRGTLSNYNKIVMPDIVPSSETKAKRRPARSDYDNVASPDNTLMSPEGGELNFYHFTPQSPRESSTKELDTNSTDALSDDYEMVG